MSLLEKITSPDDVKNLSDKKLDSLCEDIRKTLIQTVSKNGGHLASNLGVVELTVALHRVFSTPIDQIVWDVGHQCYVHKLLTGRYGRFSTLRQKDGISGFPKPAESIHDAFISGHSSTSVSVAYGLAKAKKIKNEPGKVLAVIGDGALTGGLSYEGLNNAGRDQIDNLIIIVNDNKMSISKNVGSITKHLSSMRNDPKYYKAKDRIGGFLDHIPVVGQPAKNIISDIKSTLKGSIYQSNFFEDLGFQYLGPVDGHSIRELTDVFSRAKKIKSPVVVYIDTVKGKGYEFAEKNPGAYHGVSKFNIETGNPDNPERESFSGVMGRELESIGKSDPTVCAVTAAMKYGTGLHRFAKSFPDRFFDVGIAEEHAVTFCAGLAHDGLKPVFAVYSSFLQRTYDQLIHDVAISREHVVFAVDRAGIVGQDGETHQGLFDVPMLSSVPGMTVYAPSDYNEIKACLNSALYEIPGPVALRYPRGKEDSHCPLKSRESHYAGDYYLAFSEQNEKHILIVTYGNLVSFAYSCAVRLREEGFSVQLMKLTKIFPVEDEILKTILSYKSVFFFEESYVIGSIGQIIGTGIAESAANIRYYHKAFDSFVPQASPIEIYKEHGFDAEGMYLFIKERI